MFNDMTNAERRIHEAAMRLFAERGGTQVTVSELAGAAGVARGTVYNNFKNVDSLFEDVATRLTSEMDARIAATSARTDDPARRLANGMRLFVRRAHEEPLWGRFLVRFGATVPTMRRLLEGAASEDVKLGIKIGAFQLREDQCSAAVGMMSAGVLVAISLVLDGHRTWRDAGSDAAELFLRALGVPREEAQVIAGAELPALSAADTS